jgi:hypothetical protein
MNSPFLEKMELKNYRQILPNQNKKEHRNLNDKYLTPLSLVEQLLTHIELDKAASILEPCCSVEKSIIQVLEQNGFTNLTANVYNPEIPSTDFLLFNTETKYDYIITNTPYGDKEITKFILKMKEIVNKQIICLYPLSILQGIKRYKQIWCDKIFPLKEVLLFVRPPFLTDTINANGKYKTGMTFYAWFIWEKGYIGEIQFRHINNQEFCMKKK